MEDSHMPFMYNSFMMACKDSKEVDVSSSYFADTALRLSSQCVVDSNIFDLGSGKRNWNGGYEISLALGLGSSESSLEKNTNSAGTTLTCGRDFEEQPPVDLCLDFNLNLGGKREECKELRNSSLILGASEKERPNIDLELSLSTAGATESDVTSVTLSSSPIQNRIELHASSDIVQLVDEGSASSKWKPGPFLPLSNVGQCTDTGNPVSVTPSLPSVSMQQPKSLDGAGTSRSKASRKTAVKTCQFPGCEKGARGVSGHCISHGGGHRCQRPCCPKGAEGKTAFCKAHGGGRRCEHLGCTKSAEGRTNLCIAHGGGRRCSFPEGCNRAARGKSGLCIRHGGGKRCKIENCTKSAEGQFGVCIAHGGGRRCQFPQCSKGAQGSTKFCKAHGGGKRCTVLGCTKGAEGSTPFCKGHGGGKRCCFQGGGVCTKSVHGGTLFCVSHGGGKRCAILGCTKSARGRTDFCVRHGGGRRCKFEGCGKSAQGSTEFCKAHGGGKRCLWDDGDSERPCDKFARGKTGLCAAHAAQVHDKRVHGNGTVGLKMQEVVTLAGNPLQYTDNTVGDQNPTIRKGFDKLDVGQCDGFSASGSVPEGRVHGGSLMAMLIGGVGGGADQVAGGQTT